MYCSMSLLKKCFPISLAAWADRSSPLCRNGPPRFLKPRGSRLHQLPSSCPLFLLVCRNQHPISLTEVSIGLQLGPLIPLHYLRAHGFGDNPFSQRVEDGMLL